MPQNPEPDISLGPAPSADTASTPFVPVGEPLLTEIKAFREDCNRRQKFNNRWDIVLSVLGILLSIAIVAAGFLKRPEISAVLGAVVGAVVTAQKAFPFGQRSSFYRLLLGQTDNLATRGTQGLWSKREAVDALSTLRMDYAQQLPRGSSSTSDPLSRTLPDPAPGLGSKSADVQP